MWAAGIKSARSHPDLPDLLVAGCGLEVAACKAAGCRRQAAGNGLQAAGGWLGAGWAHGGFKAIRSKSGMEQQPK